ncbi:MAG: hypothetical protein COA57_00985 [Flavobacteriales bacterium]|nr:MAG: hypothetical protein COA57_00985 [Flavobacteriales bacterium]
MTDNHIIHIALTLANNTSTPYFNRFADLAKNTPDIKLSFICLFPEQPNMIEDMAKRSLVCHWIKYDSKKRKVEMLKALLQLFLLLKKIKPDVIHTHLFDDSLPGLLAAKFAGIKTRIISKLDTGYHHNFTPQWVKFDKFNNWNATGIVSVSKESENFIIDIEKAPVDKIHLIHQGLSVEEVTSASTEIQKKLIHKFNLQNKKLILSVARHIEWKGYKYIIDAAELVIKKYPECVFLFVGYGEQQEELEKIVIQKGLSSNIIFSGWVDREDLNNLYQLSKVFVHAAINEPFGFVIAEAMLNKVPVVSTKTGCAYDGIEHLKGGYIVQNKNSKQIAEGIFYMLENDTSEMVATSFQTANNLFTVEKMWQNHCELYRKIIRKKSI